MANDGNRTFNPKKGNPTENHIFIPGPTPAVPGVIGSIVSVIPAVKITCLSRPGRRGLSPRTISISELFSDGLPESCRHE
jgi:hypothetical protein